MVDPRPRPSPRRLCRPSRRLLPPSPRPLRRRRRRSRRRRHPWLTRPPATEPEPEPEPTPLPGAGLPEGILGYQDWLRLNEQPIPPIEDGDAHLGTKDVFASREADRSGGAIVYPDGTIIVKEATRPDSDFIGLVAVMRKEAGADPDHGDWVFVEYTRSGPDAAFGVQARDAVCWSCHVGAQQTDWVWVHTTGAAP